MIHTCWVICESSIEDRSAVLGLGIYSGELEVGVTWMINLSFNE